jgi:hypothetical protein
LRARRPSGCGACKRARRRWRSWRAGALHDRLPDFERLLRELEDAGVEYIVVGGAAMALQGSARVTQDLDVLYERSPENLERLAAAVRNMKARLRALHEPEGVRAPLDARALAAGMTFTLGTDFGDFYIFGEIAGIGKYQSALAATEEHELFERGRPVRALTIEGLITAKRAAARAKDLDAIPELEAMRDLRDAGR